MKYEELLEEVGSGTRSDPHMPYVFKACAGPPTKAKIQLVNALLVDWQLPLKKKVMQKGTECPYYAPSTQAIEFRTFMGRMRTQYGWQVTENDLRGFEGAFHGVMEAEFARRREKYIQEGYGQVNKNCEVAESDHDKFKLEKFDESNLRQHQMKCAVILSLFQGLRGNKEQCFLTRSNFEISPFCSTRCTRVVLCNVPTKIY